MIVLFTSIFTMMSVIEDARKAFCFQYWFAPGLAFRDCLGKVLGGTTLATISGYVRTAGWSSHWNRQLLLIALTVFLWFRLR